MREVFDFPTSLAPTFILKTWAHANLRKVCLDDKPDFLPSAARQLSCCFARNGCGYHVGKERQSVGGGPTRYGHGRAVRNLRRLLGLTGKILARHIDFVAEWLDTVCAFKELEVGAS